MYETYHFHTCLVFLIYCFFLLSQHREIGNEEAVVVVGIAHVQVRAIVFLEQRLYFLLFPEYEL